MRNFPMPNDHLGGGTVVASVWYSDEPGEETALVLILNRLPPYFTVTYYDLNNGAFSPVTTTANIVPAIREYEQAGGDY